MSIRLAVALVSFALIPSLASAATFYASACEQTISSDRPTSAFCPGSAPQRTLPAHALHDGSSFQIRSGGRYTVPDYDKGAFAVAIKVGGAILTTTMPELLAVEGQHFALRVDCIVAGSAKLRCDGLLTLLVPLGSALVIPIAGTLAFDPGVSVDVDLVATSARGSSLTFEDAIFDVEVAR